MKKHACLLLALILCSYTSNAQSFDSLFLQTSLTKLKNAKAYTLAVADLMPETLYGYKPTPEEMSFGEQLLHIAGNLGWLSSTYLGNGENPVAKDDSKLKDKAGIRIVLTKTYDYAIGVLEVLEKNQLGVPVQFFAGPMTKLQIITLINDHQTHHRGQLMVYLRLNGLVPPKYVGW
jgi:uncharacterized damage-inducible protein DinB